MARPVRRPLGGSPLSIAPFAFGGNVFGWTADDSASFRLLDEFVDAGFNLIDTADVYSAWAAGHSGGESERILGRWLAATGRRDEVLIATKVGMEMGSGAKGLSRPHILASAAASLERLGTDRIDLYQAHVDDPTVPMSETLGAFQTLLDAGSVRAIGASNFSAARLREAWALSAEERLPRYECLQTRYNLMDRAEFEHDLAPVCRAEGVGVITYSSLASGFLSGKYRSRTDLAKSVRGARIEQRLGPRGDRVLAALDGVASRLDAPQAAVAIAWLLARPDVTAPIASATSTAQLAELLRGTDLRLDRASIDELDRASA